MRRDFFKDLFVALTFFSQLFMIFSVYAIDFTVPYDATDATNKIQAGLDSGADRVIIPYTGSKWISGKLYVHSNTELILESGVLLEAKSGAFPNSSDSFINIIDEENVTISGDGAEIRMLIDEYTDGEWRMCISVKSCSYITIEGLKLTKSGGDGIYLGRSLSGEANSNIILRDLDCDGNARQGISVISASNLTVDNCILRNTGKKTSMAFETNFSGDADGIGGTDSEQLLTSAGAQITIGDFDGDGKDDILTKGIGLYRRVYRRYNRFLNRFYALSEAATGLPEDSYFTSPDAKVYPGDYNGDGKIDLFVKGYGTWRALFLGQDSGVFTTAFASDADGIGGTDSGLWLTSPDAKVFPGDYNGDGITDLFVVGYQTYRVLYAGTKSGGFVRKFCAVNDGDNGLDSESFLTGADAQIYIGDFDGDGKDDILTKGVGTHRRLYRNYNSSLNRFYAILENNTGLSSSDSFTSPDAKIFTGDYNGDGITDLFVVGYQTYRELYEGTSSGVFSCSFSGDADGIGGTDSESFLTGADAQIVIGDYNGDGKDDILTKGGGAFRRIYQNYNPSLNRFYALTETATGLPDDLYFMDQSALLFAGDFTDDGITDLFVKGYGTYRSLHTMTRTIASSGPWAGIDFEPNNADDILDNITVSNCTFYNNGKYNILLSMSRVQTANSISITNCEMNGSRYSIFMSSKIAGGGVFNINNCTIENALRRSIYIRNWNMPTETDITVFDNVQISNENECDVEIEIESNSEINTGFIVFDYIDFSATMANYLFCIGGYSSSFIVETVTGSVTSDRDFSDPILYENDFYNNINIVFTSY